MRFNRRAWFPLLGLFGLVAMSLPALAASYSYYMDASVRNNSATTYRNITLLGSINNSELAGYGYIDANGLDTHFQEGASSVTSSVTSGNFSIFVPEIQGDQARSFRYLMGYDPARTQLPITAGYGGYIAAGDDASLELADNFEVEVNGFIDTEAGSSKNLVYKEGAFVVSVSEGEEVTSGFIESEDWSLFSSEFNGDTTSFVHSCEVDTNKFAVVYKGNIDDGIVRVGSISGTTITWGAASIFCTNIATGLEFGICKLAANKFVVVYADGTQADDGYARVGTVAGTTISWGTAVEFETDDTEYPSCCQLGTDKFVVCYNDEVDTDKGKVCVCTVSGTTITAGTPTLFADKDTSYNFNSCCKLDTDKFVIVWKDGSDSSHLKARAATVSGTTPTFGTEKGVDGTGNCYQSDCAQLDTDKFVVAWRNGTNTSGSVEICTVSGTTITEGAEVDLNPTSDEAYYLGLAKVDATHFILVYEDVANSEKGTSRFCSFSDTTITLGDEVVFHDAQTSYGDVCVTGSCEAVVVYRDDADVNDVGEAVVGVPGGHILGVSVTATGVTVGEHAIKTTADGINLKLFIDAVEEDSTALGGATVTDNANDWNFFVGNSVPYATNMTIEVAGVQKLRYEPNTMVLGTSLTDRSGSGNTGTIVWGANPVGFELTFGGIYPIEGYTPSGAGDGEIPEVFPPPEELILIEDAAATGTGLPMEGIMTRFATATDWSLPVAYAVIILIFATAVGFGVFIASGSPLGFAIGYRITAGMGGSMRDATGATVFPWWIAIVVVAIIGMGIYTWRRG